jgi:nucleoside-diphosphate-sugar epimerase
MIVGKGLIAHQLVDYKNSEEVLIFASGVSNSAELKKENFLRELDLIKSFANTEKVFIYFSTCSIFDQSNANSLYVKHKLEVEQFIHSNFNRHIIIRLPNMIGLSQNPHTFFNFFYHSIKEGNQITIQKNAVRYFMDVEDLPLIMKMIISEESSINSTLNVSYNNPILIPDALSIFEKYLNKNALATYIDKGNNYTIPNMPFLNLLDKHQVLLPEQYTENCIKKYIELKTKKSSGNLTASILFNPL